MNIRREVDGTATITLEDGRRFTLCDDTERGTLSIESVDSDLIVMPTSSAAIEIDTPIN